MHPHRPLRCAALLLALAACTPPPPPIVLHPQAAARHPPVARAKGPAPIPRCEPSARPNLTEAEKTRLFEDFDGWQGEHRPPGAAPGAPVPPPAPGTGRAAPAGCRVSPN